MFTHPVSYGYIHRSEVAYLYRHSVIDGNLFVNKPCLIYINTSYVLYCMMWQLCQ